MLSNKELAKLLYEDADIEFGMIDKPNIIITNGSINYDNGLCNEWNENAITIYAKDLKGLFKFGMILRKTSTNIQTISQDYIEYLLENNGIDRSDCLSLVAQKKIIIW